jgi:hypothetical protein
LMGLRVKFSTCAYAKFIVARLGKRQAKSFVIKGVKCNAGLTRELSRREAGRFILPLDCD